MSSERATDGGPADADAASADGGRVVNTPDGYERVPPEEAADGEDADGPDSAPGVVDADPADGDAADEEGLGRAGWVLVGVVVVAFLVIPGAIYLRPTVPAEMGLRFLAAMLVLPFLPALLLGATAVWSMTVGRE